MNGLFLFDCDETLWQSTSQDYISRNATKLSLVDADHIKRNDGGLFTLRSEVRVMLQLLRSRGCTIGIVSDNRAEIVDAALQLFQIKPYFASEAINIRLWKGHCPKEVMVDEVLKHPKLTQKSFSKIYWFDDKDYAKQATSVDVKFMRVTADSNLYDMVSNVLEDT
jgi:magnesium-dependent phosphatase-1